MTMGVKGVRMTPATRRLFDQPGVRAEAIISSNLPYMLALEYGHSRQAHYGFIRIYKSDFRRMIDAEVVAAMARNNGDVQKALPEAVKLAALRILGEIARRTPVDTGRAKGSWIVTLPDGGIERAANEVSAGQQIAIQARNRKAAKRAARKLRSELRRHVKADSPAEFRAISRRTRRQKRRRK